MSFRAEEAFNIIFMLFLISEGSDFILVCCLQVIILQVLVVTAFRAIGQISMKLRLKDQHNPVLL